jgi:hypothetical protein
MYNLKIGRFCAAVSDGKPTTFGFFQTPGSSKMIYCNLSDLTSHFFELLFFPLNENWKQLHKPDNMTMYYMGVNFNSPFTNPTNKDR